MKVTEIAIAHFNDSPIARSMRKIESEANTFKINEKFYTDYENLYNAVHLISEHSHEHSEIEDIIDNLSSTSNYVLKFGLQFKTLYKEKDMVHIDRLKLDKHPMGLFIEAKYIEAVFNPLQEIQLNILDSGGIVNYAHRVPIDSLHYNLHDLQNTGFTLKKDIATAKGLIKVIESCIKIKEELNSLIEFENKLINCE